MGSTIAQPDYAGLDNSIKTGDGTTGAPDYIASNGIIGANFYQTGNRVDFTTNGRNFTWSPLNMKYVDNTGSEDIIYSVQDVPIEVKANYARFNRPMTDVDDWFIFENNMLKHQILVQGFQRDPAPYLMGEIDFVFGGQINYDSDLTISVDGLNNVAGPFETGGSIHFLDSNGREVYSLPQIVAYDSGIPNRAQTTGKYRVTQNSAGVLAFDIVVDNAWFADTARIYPIVIDPTVVVSSAYSLGSNGGRKMVRLSNNWIVTAVYSSSSPTNIYFYLSKDNGSTWSQIMARGTSGATDWAIASSGTVVYVVYGQGQSIFLSSFDASLASPTFINDNKFVDQNQTATGGVSLVIDGTGALHAAWASKNSAYPSAFNIRYSKSTDNGTTWATPTQISNLGTTGYAGQNPCIIVRSNNYPTIVYEATTGSTYAILAATWNGSAWLSMYNGNGQTIMPYDTYSKTNPCAAVDSNDVIHVVWHGTDSSHPSYSNIRYSKSTDGGSTWAAQTLLTTDNTYLQAYPSISIDQSNNLYVYFHGIDSAVSTSYNNVRRIIYTSSGWSAIVTISNNTTGNAYYPQTLWSKFNMNCSDAIRYMWQDAQASAVKYDSYLLNSPPNAPTNLKPTGGGASPTLTPTLTGAFSDPDAGNTMSALQVKVYRSSDNTLMWDSTKTALTTTAQNQNFAIQVPSSAGLAWNVQYYWTATTWDNSDAQGATSTNQVFQTSQAPTVTVTSPTSNQSITSSSITATLSYSQISNKAQASYQFQLLDATGTNVLQDSGVINGTNNQYTFNGLANNTSYQIIAYATTKDGVQGTSTKVTFSTSFTPPQVPTVTTTNDATNARVRVDFANPAITTNIARNSDFETITGTGTLLSDALNNTSAPGWSVQSGSFTYGAGGATSGAAGSLMTAGNSAWKPLTGSNGSALSVTLQTTFTQPATVGLERISLYMDSNNYYQAYVGGGNFVLAKVVGGTTTNLTYVAQPLTASQVTTITLSITPSGVLTAKLYSGSGTGGTLLQTLTATDTSLSGGFQIGVGGDTGVKITNAITNGPVPDWWGGISYSNSQTLQEGWMALSNANPINGNYSVVMNCVYVSGDARVVVGPNQPATAGQAYTGSVYAKGSTAGGGKGLIRIIFLDSTGSTVQGTPQYTYFTPSNTTQRYSVTATAPANTGMIQVSIGVECFASGDSGTITFDEVQIEQTATANAYVRNDSTTSSASNYPSAAYNRIYKQTNGAWVLYQDQLTGTSYTDYLVGSGVATTYGVSAVGTNGVESGIVSITQTPSYTGDWLYDTVTGNQFQFLYNRKAYSMDTLEERKEFQTFGSKPMVRRGPLNAKKGTLAALMVKATGTQTPLQQIQALEASIANHPVYYLKTAAGEVLKVDVYNAKRSMPVEYLNPQAIEYSVDWTEVA